MINKAKSAPSDLKKDDMSAMCIKIGGKSAYPKAIAHLAGAKEDAAHERKAG